MSDKIDFPECGIFFTGLCNQVNKLPLFKSTRDPNTYATSLTRSPKKPFIKLSDWFVNLAFQLQIYRSMHAEIFNP